MRLLIAGVLLLAVSCSPSQPSSSQRPASPGTQSRVPAQAVARATGGDAEAFAQQACTGSQYVRCVESILTVLDVLRIPGRHLRTQMARATSPSLSRRRRRRPRAPGTVSSHPVG